MSHTPNSLHEAFPEFGARISELKVEDRHFGAMADQYDSLNHEVHRIETDLEPASDEVLEDLKKQRLAVKDQIFQALTQA